MTDAVQTARKLGAFGVELLYVEDRGVVLEMDGPRVGPEQPFHQANLEVRVWLEGGRFGHTSGDPANADALVEQVMLIAAEAPSDPHEGPMGRQQPVPGGLSIRDRRHDQLTRDDRAEVLATAQRSAMEECADLTTHGFRYRDRDRVRRYASSRGVELEERGTTYLAEGEVTVGTPQGTLRLWDSIASRSFASIASLPYGTNLGRRAVALVQDGPQLPLGPTRVLLPARVVATLFAAVAEGFVHANFATEGTFFLVGAPPLDAKLHLLDDGTLPGALRSRAFDDRGVAPIPLTLLREGEPVGRLVDVTTARRIEGVATGHDVAGGLRPNNLILKSGTRSVNATLSELGGSTFRVDAIPSSAVDVVTGRLDATVDGVVMEANRAVGAMRRVRLSGNLGDVLRQVVEVCSDTDRVGHVDAPALIVEGFELG